MKTQLGLLSVVFLTACEIETTHKVEGDATIRHVTEEVAEEVTAGPTPVPTQTVVVEVVVTVVVSPSPSPSPSPTPVIPIGHWGFEEASGAQVLDASGMSQHGSLIGNATRTTGCHGKALSLSGVGGYAEIPDSSILRPSEITMMAWVKPLDFNDHRIILQKFNDHGPAGYYLWLTPDRNIRAAVNSGGGESAPQALSALSWAHVAVRYDGSKQDYFLGGVKVASFNAHNPGPIQHNSQPLRIGMKGDEFYFNGLIDEVKIFDRALTDSEIADIYEPCD